MRVIAVRSFGAAPEIMEVAKPVPAEGEVLVRLAAAGINPFDWKIADGMLEGQVAHTFPLVLGFDGAGTVESLGAGVGRFQVGDSVLVQAWQMPLGRGTYAPYVTVSETAPITRCPKSLAAVDVAALPTAGMAALDLLDKLALGKSQMLLVVGATGGVGQFLVQLARNRGMRVIATGSAADVANMKALGAEFVVDFTRGSIVEQVRQFQSAGVDGLVDLVSDAAAFARCIDSVKSGGIAFTSNYVADEKVLGKRAIRGGNFTVGASSSLLGRVAAAAVELKINVERRVGFDDAISTLAAMRTGHARGKSVILL